MRIQLISHASVVISTDGCNIWTDPWLKGTAFNDSWALYPPAYETPGLLDEVNYIWISHEHPDHFHIPTLRGLPSEFKEKTPILFQKNNSEKMFKALRGMGFKKFIELPHRKIIQLDAGASVYCYQVGNMDSALGVISPEAVVLNVNDAEMNSKDCALVKKDLGQIHTVLNQFSIAGYSGQEDLDKYLPKLAGNILDNFVSNHRDLGAKRSIPFASFIYFCQLDNKYINKYANTPHGVANRMQAEGLECTVLYPGDVVETAKAHDSHEALKKYQDLFSSSSGFVYGDVADVIELDRIRSAYLSRFEQIDKDFWKISRTFLKDVVVKVPDLECNIVFSMKDNRFDVMALSDECDLVVNSQPLWFLFAMPFGCQTLGVSARYTLRKGLKNWKFYRVLFSLNNAEMYLSWSFFRWENVSWMGRRLGGILNQLVYQIQRM